MRPDNCRLTSRTRTSSVIRLLMFGLAAVMLLGGCPTDSLFLVGNTGGLPELAGTWAISHAEDGLLFGLFTFDEAGQLIQMCYQVDFQGFGIDPVRIDGRRHAVGSGAELVATSDVSQSDGLVDIVVDVRILVGLAEVGHAVARGTATLANANTGAATLQMEWSYAGVDETADFAVTLARVSSDTAGCMGDDQHGGTSAETALPLARGENPELRWLTDDWYQIVLDDNEIATVTLNFEPGWGPVSMTALRGTGGSVEGPSTQDVPCVDGCVLEFMPTLLDWTSWDDNSVKFPPGPATYLLYVSSLAGSVIPHYGLTLETRTLTEDTFVPAATAETAYPLEPGSYDLTLLRDDWFRVELEHGGQILVTADFENRWGDIDLELYYEDLNPLATSLSDTNQEIVSGSLDSGVFLIHVYGWNGNANTYELSVAAIEEDAYEPNDSEEAVATLTAPGSYTFAGFDDDWFRVQVGTASLSATVTIADPAVDLDLELYDSDGTFLSGSYSTGSTDQVTGNSPTGALLLHVYPYAGTSSYGLELVLTTPNE